MARLRSWSERTEYYTEMYENSFFIADIYESFALLVLGHVVMRVLRGKVRQDCADAAAESDRVSKTISARKLMTEMKELTTFGIKFFCWTCGLQALYQLLLTTMGYYGILNEFFGLGDKATSKAPGLLHTPGVQNKSHYFFLGAGFVASFAAIGNVVKVESAFHHQLKEFEPFWKFWGTKIIVSIGFLQSMALWVLPPFCWWSPIRQNLFYAALLCFECFLVSLMHLKAWAHDQSWYLGFAGDRNSESDESASETEEGVERTLSSEALEEESDRMSAPLHA
eukprot:CAMPEP_0176326320 /NCGR_PEP_ID=MMETSP0121_2-20121125/73866_1 /TAXON_ID=160619 /ORGANISM="Kryptoperidinium foliaceum, Strain CCMP 1326" /LENGTH=280 /DNA_ID=CAMNT_0017668915 /DNA_START=1 /DNA_END=840 /DNA_ORIENTATION=+